MLQAAQCAYPSQIFNLMHRQIGAITFAEYSSFDVSRTQLAACSDGPAVGADNPLSHVRLPPLRSEMPTAAVIPACWTAALSLDASGQS